MDLPARAALLLAALAVAAALWSLRQRGSGRVRAVDAGTTLPSAWTPRDGADLTLVQISSRYCSSCARSARVWTAAVADRPGVGFVEVDAEDHLDVVRGLGVLTTPTTLIVDAAGALAGRVSGAPSPRQAAEALDQPIGAAR